ncbi:hypothetical protein ARAM_001190 [Aspergillus rambellii]|uniref:Uncharacterized protein n=1 Tax=Aspergillus rambellii TaxID=308745 RepID=A0A0F8V6V8_9EURO|nr:hypothetical protein ARAM_001190 [Aspergillus rambellii]
MRPESLVLITAPVSRPIQAAAGRSYSGVSYLNKPGAQSDNVHVVEFGDFGTPTSAGLKDDQPGTPQKRRRRLYIPNTLWTRSFAITGIIETVITVGIESWIIMSISNRYDTTKTDDGTLLIRSFLGLYIFGLLYELALAYDALKRENTFQLIGLCICNFGLLTYGIVQQRDIRDAMIKLAGDATSGHHLWGMYRIPLILVPVFLAVGTLLMVFETWKLHGEFSWSIYKNISADLQMNRRYTTYQVYIALLKFDFFFVFGTQLQILLGVKSLDNSQFISQAALVPTAIVSLVLAARFCRLEMTKALIAVMVVICALIANLTTIVFRLYNPTENDGLGGFGSSLSLFASVAILLLTGTLLNSVLCMLNFQKGLKQHTDHFRRRGRGTDVELSQTEGRSRFILN